MGRLTRLQDKGGKLDFDGYVESGLWLPALRGTGKARVALRAGLVAALLTATVLMLGAVSAQAKPEGPSVTTVGGAVQWNAVGSEWGYKIGVSNVKVGDARRKTTYFEIKRSNVAEQTFSPIAYFLTFIPIGTEVYVGVATLAEQGVEPDSNYSVAEAIVPWAGQQKTDPAPSAVASSDSQALQWKPLGGLHEAGYEVKVWSDPLPHAPGSKPKTFIVARDTRSEPQTFKPDPARLGIISLPATVYAEVGTIVIPGEEPAEWTHLIALTIPPEKETIVTHFVNTPSPTPPPVSTVAPSVSGAALVGSSLTADPGGWRGEPTSYVYQWQLCNVAGGSCHDISGATGASIPLAGTDVGQTLRVLVTASNPGGSASAVSPPSAVIGSEVGASMEWLFGLSNASTWTVVKTLKVIAIPSGGVVEVACRGRGCPISSTHVSPSTQTPHCKGTRCPHTKPTTQVDLARLFKAQHLSPGTTITVRIVERGWVGKVYTFTMRAHATPSHSKACLAQGSTKPIPC